MGDRAPLARTTEKRGRITLVATALSLAALDLGIKAWAERGLADGRVVDLGLIQLRIAFNPGVAFSLGETLPAGLVLAVTGAMIAVLIGYAWRVAPTAPLNGRVGLAVVLAGALANFADRAADGVVTDYLHTGWFPTFNGADMLITFGVIALILASLRSQPTPTDGCDRAG